MYEFLTLKSGSDMLLACSDSALACFQSLIRFIGFAGWISRLEYLFGLLREGKSDKRVICFGSPGLISGASWCLRLMLVIRLTVAMH